MISCRMPIRRATSRAWSNSPSARLALTPVTASARSLNAKYATSATTALSTPAAKATAQLPQSRLEVVDALALPQRGPPCAAELAPAKGRAAVGLVVPAVRAPVRALRDSLGDARGWLAPQDVAHALVAALGLLDAEPVEDA